MKTSFTLRSACFVLLLAAPGFARAESSVTDKTVSAALSAKATGAEVHLFEGMKSGEIEVTFIPKDATEATILFKNNTGKPVAIKVPEAFAGVPVLAQFGGPGGVAGAGGRGRRGAGAAGMGGGMGGMGGMQGMMGGMGGMGGMMGGMGMGGMGGMGMGGMGGFMNVAPDKIAKLKVPLVCLEHGKKDPNPRVKYELKPIESFTQDRQVIEIGKMLSRKEIDQKSAQAATWHVANHLSWPYLASKDRIHLSNGYSEKFFNQANLTRAAKIVLEADRRAKEQPAKNETRTPGASDQ
jgi:hypothetical protein